MSAKVDKQRTTWVPVTTMEEVPVLSAEEREQLLRELQEAEAEIEAGDAVDFDMTSFTQELFETYTRAKRTK